MSGDSLGKRGENEGRASKCDERKFLESPADIRIAVTGSQLKLNEKGREVLSFTLTIRNPTNEDLWKIEKAYADFLQLDTKLKSSTTKAVSSKIGKLPDKALFTTHSPTKNDQRKVQLELYTQNVLELCRHSPEMIAFLSTNVLDAAKQSAGETGANVSGTIKEGYLFKKGKNFGAWKSRFFVLRSGGAFEYFESQKDRTSLLGGIKLKYVFVSRQSGTAPLDGLPTSDDGTDTQSGNDTDYRHAFMLTEYKKSCFAPEAKEKGGEQFSESRVISRHILCAENDEERDEWVRLIAREIKLVRPDTTRNGRKPVDERGEVAEPSQQQQPGPTIEDRAQPIDIKMAPGRDARVQDIQQEDPFSAPSQPSTGFGQSPDEAPVQSETPEEHPVAPRRTASIAIMSTSNEALSLAHAMGGGRAGTTSSSSPSKGRTRNFVDDNERVMMQAEPPPLLSPEESRERGQSAAVNIPQAGSKATDKKSKRITTFNWGKKSKDQLSSSNSRSQTLNDRGRRVFGVPLDQAVAISRVREDLQLPAVLYRCIEYLDAKNANEEEGIYRLSGSSSVIQGLKAAFDAEGDVDLLGSQQFYDVHAVAGLLKLYLRELPSPVLTKELQRSFLHVMDLADREERIFELARLVALLPIPNYTLLKILMAHLVRVVRRADINKMNIRNVGIVFSPTVGVPAGVFTLMMAEYASVF
ncbi:uncharacterized protein EV422DRAFT_500334, partial [Fimicolochytrium jonesii]|uniref:uncharacterized protein n=1 Tax=Fimicolochytrium jonesii TaxID=1396493 RepID=UPI0022FEB911